MRLVGKIALRSLLLLLALVLLLALSIPGDALIGGGRVAALTNTTIENPDGPAVQAFVVRPPDPGPHPAVIMIHEFWGLRPEIVGKAEALAAEGYVVIAPDTFRGSSTSWLPRAIYQTIRSDPAQVATDLDAVFGWLATQPDVDPARVAIMGFCYGGRVSLQYSLHNPAIAATAIFYGMTETTSAELATLNGPVLGIFGGADQSIPADEVAALEANLQAADVPHTITVYDGQPHAFVGSIEEIRAGGPAQEAWDQLRGFLDAALRSGQAPESGAPLPPGTSVPSLVGRLHHLFVCQPWTSAPPAGDRRVSDTAS
jgi:carboxymethylenebutenolidase